MGPSLAGKPQPKMQWDSERDTAISKKAKELLASDPEIKALEATNPYLAWRKAIAKAAAAIPPKGGGFGGSQGDVARSQGDAKLSRAALERARQVHKGAMILLKTDPTYQELATRDYPKAFDAAHNVADGEYGEQRLLVPLKIDANALKPGREETVYQRALTTLKTALRSRDAYDSIGAFDEAIRDAEATTPLDSQPPSARGGWQIDEKPPRPR